MLKRLNLILLLLFLMVNLTPSIAQNKPTAKRTIKQIVPVDRATEPYFAIQVLALKDAPNNASFFKNIESAREFSCTDGYKRYVVGRYKTKAEAVANLATVRAKGPKYAKSYVVNTANFSISSSFNSEYSDETNEETTDKNDNLSSLRTTKKIVPVDKVTQPPFAIQILALKNPPQDPNFFVNVNSAREFSCTDGFARYVVGQYESIEVAKADLPRVRSLSLKYKSAFVVNTSNFSISASAFSSEFDTESVEGMDITALRTNKRIIPVDRLNPQLFTCQVLALKETPKDAAFFGKLKLVKEASCTDGYKRYLVGEYATPEEARSACTAIRKLGPKYKNAFIISNQNIKLDASAYSAEYVEPQDNIVSVESKQTQVELVQSIETEQNSSVQSRNAEKSNSPTNQRQVVTPVERNIEVPTKTQNVVAVPKERIVAANNEVVESGGTIEFIDERLPKNTVVEKRPIKAVEKNMSAEDNISIKTASRDVTTTRNNDYVIENPKKTTVVNNTRVIDTPNMIRTSAGDVAIKTEEKVLINSRKTIGVDNTIRTKSSIDNTQLPSNRTGKKIIPIDKVAQPYYTIQILALKDAPIDPNFFDNIESANEFSCKDGYKRYVVGKYNSYEEAKADVARVKALSPKYKNSFVSNTNNYDISLDDFRRDFVAPSTEASVHEDEDGFEDVKHTALNKQELSSKAVRSIEPNKVYTIQLTASRYPFYVSELKEFKEVYEFYMPDKVFRYTVGKYNGNEIQNEIKKVVAFGYVEAFAVEWTKYLPYKIE